LITPYKIKENERHLLSENIRHLDEIPPDYVRTGSFFLSHNIWDDFFMNFIVINSYLFYIFILKNATSLHRNKKRSFIDFIKVNLLNSALIDANNEKLILHPSNIDAKQAFESQIFFNYKIYDDWYIETVAKYIGNFTSNYLKNWLPNNLTYCNIW
jgi:hypothetical protein